MKHRRIRADLIAGPHPEDPETYLLYDTSAGRQFEIPAEGWRLLSAFDGTRSTSAVARRVGVTVEVAEGFEASLASMGLLCFADSPSSSLPKIRPQWSRRPVPDGLSLRIHPEARFECSQAGSCCRSGYVIPLSVSNAASVRRAALRVLGSGVDPVGLFPTTDGAPWTYALDNSDSCPFLDDASSCLIHRAKAYPPACRIFPFVFARVDEEVFVSIAHRCVCGSGGAGRRLIADRPAIRARLRLAERVATVPKRARVDDREATGSAVVDALIRSTEQDQVWAMLQAAAEGLATVVGAPPSRARGVDNDRLYANITRTAEAWRDPILDAALGRQPHPERRQIHEDLKRGGLWSNANDANAECARFVRDHLYGLRVFHYETIAAGLLALGIAAANILRSNPTHPVVRERVMLWEEALTTDAMPRIVAATKEARRMTRDIRRTAVQLERLSS